MSILYPLIFALAIGVIVFLIRLIAKKPTGQKDWSPDQAILPWAEIGAAEIDALKITLHNIRNFTYRTQTDYTAAYYDKTFRLDDIISLDFVMEPFSGYRGAAHTLVTFGLRDANRSGNDTSNDASQKSGVFHIAISIEIRKQKGETFSAIKGLFKHFELMYVVADERDVIGLRANMRHDDVYLYPIKASTEKIRAFFLEILHEVNSLKEKPEFYHTTFNTCSTNLARHANAVSPKLIPRSWKIVVPEYCDRLLYKKGLLDNSVPFATLKEKCHINARAAAAKDDMHFFSEKIRKQIRE